MATVSSETGPRACSIAYRSMSAWDGCSPRRPASPPFRKLLTSSGYSCEASSARPGRATTRSTLPLTTRRVSAQPSGIATAFPRRSTTSTDCPPSRAAAAAKPTRVRRDVSRNSRPTSGGRVSWLATPARRPVARDRICRISSVPRSSTPTITRFGAGVRPSPADGSGRASPERRSSACCACMAGSPGPARPRGWPRRPLRAGRSARARRHRRACGPAAAWPDRAGRG